MEDNSAQTSSNKPSDKESGFKRSLLNPVFSAAATVTVEADFSNEFLNEHSFENV